MVTISNSEIILLSQGGKDRKMQSSLKNLPQAVDIYVAAKIMDPKTNVRLFRKAGKHQNFLGMSGFLMPL